MSEDTNDIMLQLKDFTKYYVRNPGSRKYERIIKAVNGVSFSIRRGQTVGLVGESGSGKSTIGRAIVRDFEATSGEILFRADPSEELMCVGKMDKHQLMRLRSNIQMVFQNPYSSLNPRMTVRDIVAEPLLIHKTCPRDQITDSVISTLNEVGMQTQYYLRYPHSFSGGQRQRIAIARAIISNPKLILLDESVSMLDVSIRAQILNLLVDIQKKYSLSYLFISHDLSVIRYICDSVVVLYCGKIMETSPKEELIGNPVHPYSIALMDAMPSIDKPPPDYVIRGEIPDPANPPGGCYYHPRCDRCSGICKTEAPELRDIGSGRSVACHNI